jgi:hypothetical protein
VPVPVVVCVVFFAGLLLVGAICTALLPAAHAGPRSQRLGARVGATVEEARRQLGRFPAAAVAALAGWAAALVLCWWLGVLARTIEPDIDHPIFRFWARHQIGGTWSSTWWKLTNIGAPGQTQGVALVAAIFFAIVWWRRGRSWWVPVVTFAAAYAFEKFGQTILKLVVHRGHPPTTLGTWPSGGCARLLVIYGLVIFFFLTWWQPQNRRVWYLGWMVLSVCLGIEMYAREYNQEHWFTDVLGGIAYGTMLLLVMIGAYHILDGSRVVSSTPSHP